MEYRWIVLTVTTVGVLMAGIDSRILIVGLPTIAAALSANAVQAIWFTQAYTLGSTVVIMVVGRLTDIFGRVKIYIIGFIIFTISSLLTSISIDPNMVILFRAIQGFGAGTLMVNSAALITDATPPNKLGLSLGINQIAMSTGSIFGLTISGVMISLFGWRSLFYINVPIGIFGSLWAKRRLREIAKTERGSPLDWIGFATFTSSITSLLLALTLAAYGTADMIIVYGLLTFAIAILAVFVMHERRTKFPMLDLSLLKIRLFSGGIITMMMNAVAFGATSLLLSFYMQLSLGLSPFDTGIRLIPMDIMFITFGVIFGRLSDRFGPLVFTTCGLAIQSTALLLLSSITTSTQYSTLVIYILLMGIGSGMFATPNISSIMGAVPPTRRGVASAFRGLAMNLGIVLSLNVAMLVMTFTVPFPVLSAVISGSNRNLSGTDMELFIQAIKNTYLCLSVINFVAIIPSALRGRRKQDIKVPKTSELTNLEI